MIYLSIKLNVLFYIARDSHNPPIQEGSTMLENSGISEIIGRMIAKKEGPDVGERYTDAMKEIMANSRSNIVNQIIRTGEDELQISLFDGKKFSVKEWLVTVYFNYPSHLIRVSVPVGNSAHIHVSVDMDEKYRAILSK